MDNKSCQVEALVSLPYAAEDDDYTVDDSKPQTGEYDRGRSEGKSRNTY